MSILLGSFYKKTHKIASRKLESYSMSHIKYSGLRHPDDYLVLNPYGAVETTSIGKTQPTLQVEGPKRCIFYKIKKVIRKIMMTFVILSMKLNLWKLEQWLDKGWKKYEQKYSQNSLDRDEIQARIFKFFEIFSFKIW